MKALIRSIFILALVAGLVWLGLAVNRKIEERKSSIGRIAAPDHEIAVPVEVATVEEGAIELRRDFSGTLAAHAQFVVAPKVAGRVEEIAVDLDDTVRRGQTVAKLDDAEFKDAVTRAEADLAVAEARVLEVQASLDQATTELDRQLKLSAKGIATGVDLDAAKAVVTARKAAHSVAEAQVRRAQADIDAAKTRLDYTRIVASWDGGSDERKVAERFVDTGENLSVNEALLSIVELDPIKATIFVTEGDYRRLERNQRVKIVADAHPGKVFEARVERIAPVFRRESRQARVELVVPNPELELRPGMFIRAEIIFERRENAVIVPAEALARRAGEAGIFIVGDDERARWLKVEVGIVDGDRIEILDAAPSGRVVTLGQQLLEDGSLVKIFEGLKPRAEAAR